MTKFLTISIISLLMNFITNCNMKSDVKEVNCFSQNNFDKVYCFIEMKTQTNKSKGYIHGDWEILAMDNSDIFFRKKEYLLSRINREMGVISLPKLNSDNLRVTKITNQLFCELVLLAKNETLHTKNQIEKL